MYIYIYICVLERMQKNSILTQIIYSPVSGLTKAAPEMRYRPSESHRARAISEAAGSEAAGSFNPHSTDVAARSLHGTTEQSPKWLSRSKSAKLRLFPTNQVLGWGAKEGHPRIW